LNSEWDGMMSRSFNQRELACRFKRIDMDIESTKLELVRLMVNIDNPDIINKLHNALTSGQENLELELTDHEMEEIKRGIQQLDAGQRASLEDFLKKVS